MSAGKGEYLFALFYEKGGIVREAMYCWDFGSCGFR